ncbi:MAG: hypothetical protein R3E50_07100 [Halioglobus sp.]
MTSLGAVFHNENGRHVFFAPGETVQLPGGHSFVVAPVMERQEVETLVIGDALGAMGAELEKLEGATAKKEAPPTWFYFLFFGIPMLVVAGPGLWRGPVFSPRHACIASLYRRTAHPERSVTRA